MEHRSQAEQALGGAAYGMLFVLGLVMGVIGGFTQASWHVGQVPASAVTWVVALFGACLGAGLLMRSRLAAALLALGWLLVSMPLSFQLASGDLIISSGWAGIVYLFGGMGAVVVAFLMTPSSGGSWLLRGYQPKPPDMGA